MNRLRWIVLAAWAALAPSAALAEPDDFVVQHVCVDRADAIVPGDPALCGKTRLLRIGEIIPDRRTDAGNWQALYSYPVTGLNGEVRAMAAKVFGGADTSGSFWDLGARSGYDLLEVGPVYVSGIRTSDQGAGDQIFWRTTDCIRTDGWIMFPTELAPGGHGETRSTLRITPGPSTDCPFMLIIGPDYTVWDRPVDPFHYTSGKVLDTIQSMHFDHGDPADRHSDTESMEKFYFTKEYGFSRWESWRTPAACQRRAARIGRDPDEFCRPSSTTICNGPNTAVFFGKSYVRLDCRDSTFYAVTPGKSFNPLVSNAAPGDVRERNLLANPTFFDGLAGWQAAGWTMADLAHEAGTNDSVLHVAGDAGTLAQSFTIPPDPLGAGRMLRWGVSLKGTGQARATLVLTLTRDGEAPLVIAHTIEATGPGGPSSFTTAAPAALDKPVEGRFELRADGPFDAVVDDAFIAVLDRGNQQ